MFQIKDIRVNGSAASYIVGTNPNRAYNDLDLIFRLNLSSPDDLDRVKGAVLMSLMDFLPVGVSRERMSPTNIGEAYVHKMVKIYNGSDRWSLISLSNTTGRNVELKFVDAMRRQFEFSIDSFQIVLDCFLTFGQLFRLGSADSDGVDSTCSNFYPTVRVESIYGDFDAALDHLDQMLIATRNPEEIRGGGLFKYCNLLARGYRLAAGMDAPTLERYMCSRFFIDFPDPVQQSTQLSNYIANHFEPGETESTSAFLGLLHSVVGRSATCLAGHRLRQALNLFHQMAMNVQYVRREQDIQAYHKQVAMSMFDAQNMATAAMVPSPLMSAAMPGFMNFAIAPYYTYHVPYHQGAATFCHVPPPMVQTQFQFCPVPYGVNSNARRS